MVADGSRLAQWEQRETRQTQQAQGVTAPLASVPRPGQLDAPTPCELWKVRDVLNHIVGGLPMWVDAARGKGPSGPPTGMPDDVISGCNLLDFQARVFAGLAVGWIHKPVALGVERSYGRGRLVERDGVPRASGRDGRAVAHDERAIPAGTGDRPERERASVGGTQANAARRQLREQVAVTADRARRNGGEQGLGG
mgnify:CR=1 FL=1